jgi:hypothetical protein
MLGFLFGRNELRALKEFEEEVRWEMTRMAELLKGTYEDVGSVGKPR